jgi:hypothetical protein
MVNHYRDGIQVILDDFDYTKLIRDYQLTDTFCRYSTPASLQDPIEHTQESISRELTKSIKRQTQREIRQMQMDTNVSYVIMELGDSYGEYATDVSTDDSALIYLSASNCYVSFIDDQVRHDIKDTVSHELKHHFDRREVENFDYFVAQEIDEKEHVEFSSFLMYYLYFLRIEGLASFQNDTRYRTFIEDTIFLSQDTGGYLSYLQQNWRGTPNKDINQEYIDTVLEEYTLPRGIAMTQDHIYDIGKNVVDTIAFSRTKGKRKSISPNLYGETLLELQNLDIFDFYVEYHEALRALSVPQEHAVIETQYLDLFLSL